MNKGAALLGRFFQSQQAAAARLAIDPSFFSLLLAGKRLPSIETAAAIEREYGVPCRLWVEPADASASSVDAVDPSAADSGTPTTREKGSSSSSASHQGEGGTGGVGGGGDRA